MDALASLATSKLSASPAFTFPAAGGWLAKLNAIYQKLYSKTQFSTASPTVVIDDSKLLSGPWIVSQGALCYASLPDLRNSGASITNLYKNVSFIYSETDSPGGVTVNTEIGLGDLQFPTTVLIEARNDQPANQTIGRHTFQMLCTQACNITATLIVQLRTINETLPDPTAQITFGPDAAFSYSLGAWNGTSMIITVTITKAIAANTLASLAMLISVTDPGDEFAFGSFDPLTAQGGITWLTGQAGFSLTATAATDTDIIHPGSTGKKVVATPFSTVPVFTLDSVAMPIVYRESNGVKGVWSANTLPVPAINGFLDQDFAPYIVRRDLVSGITAIGLGENDAFITDPLPPNITDTGMKQFAPMPQSDPKINEARTAITVRPVQWPVIRDTETYPTFDFDYYKQNTDTAQNLAANGTFGDWIFLPLINATFKGLAFQFINPTPSPMPSVKFYFRTGVVTIDPSNPGTYDFSFTGTSFTIPDDVPAEFQPFYTETNFTYLIQDISGVAHQFTFRLQFQFKDTNGNFYSWPLMIPKFQPVTPGPYLECGSYRFTPGNNQPALFGTLSSLPIPQYGYCVYRVMARRRPALTTSQVPLAPNATSPITVKLGIMRSGVFVQFTTATIAIGRADTGFTSVFWPVMFGAPLVYQCDEALNVTAWVNFQPPLFSSYQGLQFLFANIYPEWTGVNPGNEYGGPAWFASNWAKLEFQKIDGNGNLSTVQFPACAEIYNDLEALLSTL